VVRAIDGECYSPLSALLEATGAPVVLNINYSLTRQLLETGSPTIARLAAARGIEFTASGAYHPILPLIPPAEVERQIRINHEGNSAAFGSRFAPSGVFPPEMAVSPGLFGQLAALGYSWSVADDVPWVAGGREAPSRWIPECCGLRIFLRSNFWSNRISFHGGSGSDVADQVVRGLDSWAGPEADAYVLIAMDGETFGHHRRGAVESFLGPFVERLMTSGNAMLTTLSSLVSLYPVRKAEVPAGSWSTTAEDVAAGRPWPLWDDPGCADHAGLKELRNMVLAWARSAGGDEVAGLADRMLYSCPFWWAAPGRRSPTQVRRGVLSMIETALAALRVTGDRAMMDRVMASAGRIPSTCSGDED
jgi:hypothetical protein